MKVRTLSLAILSAFLVSPVVLFSPGAVSAQRPEHAQVLDLASLVREAMARNPEIAAAGRAIAAKRARIPQARAWPDPTLRLSYGGNLLPPFTVMGRDPSSARQFMAEQEIPYPGKTHLRGQIATRDADAEALAYEAVERRVASEVKQVYFDLYFADQSLSTFRKDRALLEQFEKIAEIRYSVGKAAQQDVLKAQVELSKLAERETLLQQQRRTLEAQLNSLRDLPPDAPVGPTGDLRPSSFALTLEELEKAAEANFPDLKRARTVVDAGRLGVELARKEVRPNFSVGYTYMQRDGLPDMYGITLSTSLPLFRRHKQDMVVAEAAANLEASQHMEANEAALLRYRVEQEFLQAQAAGRLMKLYSQAIVPQSTLTLESSLSGYKAGTLDFLTVITNFTNVLDSELSYQQQLASHEKALARLEELTGVNLVQ
jgi:cobalt-zinc-cadmium efflux system outer membrane protein